MYSEYKRKLHYDSTTNRSVFNKLHKEIHASCSWCKWHRRDNAKGKKWYGCVHQYNGKVYQNFPSWKLVSKNKKQWMYKSTLNKKQWTSAWGSYGFEFQF